MDKQATNLYRSTVSGDKGVGIKGWLSGPRRPEPKNETVILEPLDKHRIAVLPMSNISPDPADEYFADGMTEEMILTVSKIEGLEVISRTSIMQYKKNTKPVKEVGQALSVGTLLEGSVRKAGNKLRVTVQLIDTTRDKHLWSNRYDRDIQDVFAIQTDIAEKVADALKLELLGEKREEIRSRTPDNPEVYSLYLKGRFYWNERNTESVKKAKQYFESAIAKDPRFALPYVGLADCLIIEIDQGQVDEKEASVKARSLLDSALKINNRLAEAHASLANLLDRDWKWAAAEAEYRKAIELDPNYATAHHWYHLHLSFIGREEESLNELKVALRLDPISPILIMNLGLRLAETGHIEEGIDQLKRTLEIEPDFSLANSQLGNLYITQSKFEEGIAQQQISLKSTHSPWPKAMIAYAHALSGDQMRAREILAELEESSKKGFVPIALLGVIHFALGDKEKAFTLIKRGFDERSAAIPYIKTFTVFKNIRADPRFMSLLDKITE
jgi:adenylate cyclase